MALALSNIFYPFLLKNLTGILRDLAKRQAGEDLSGFCGIIQNNIQPVQQRQCFGHGEFCFLERVQVGGNEIITGIGKIGPGQVGVEETTFTKIGAGAVGIGQVAFIKIGFFGYTIDDDSTFQIQPHEGVVTEITGVKFGPLNPFNFGPIDAHQLAILKFGALKGAIFDVDEAQIAVLELAVTECAALELGLA
jgi:hypothetical protein